MKEKCRKCLFYHRAAQHVQLLAPDLYLDLDPYAGYAEPEEIKWKYIVALSVMHYKKLDYLQRGILLEFPVPY